MTSTHGHYGPETYGDRVAAVYDDWYGSMEDVGPAAELLAGLARNGAGEGGLALELAIGTGRVALPLAALGVEVHGVDASPEMIARLRAKPGGDALNVVLGDMADVPIEADGGYPLVFVVFNTLFCLLTQEDQMRCFTNVAARLRPGGAFLIQAFQPDVSRFERGQHLSTTSVSPEEVRIEASRVDPVRQLIEADHVVIAAGNVRLYPIRLRYAYPAELDLMARLAGLWLESRNGGWRGEPFTADSPNHVSVYRKA